jgi:nitronate monooxygenase
MAGVQDAALAIAVSNAGGLGALPCAPLDPGAMRAQLTKIRDGTDRPYAVNFFCHTPPTPDPFREAVWQRALQRYYHELGIAQSESTSGPGRRPFDTEAASIVEEFKPPVVSFHFGLPSDALLERVRATGAKILATATSVEEARWLEIHDVDGIIAQGAEAGGHRGMFLTDAVTAPLATLDLVRPLAKVVRTPIIAAGGIATHRDVGEALAAGAAAVQVGTAYLLADEATTSAVHRATLETPAASHTAFTNVFTGRPARGIVNRLMRELGPMSDLAPPFPLAAGAVMPLRIRAESLGLADFSALWAGTKARAAERLPAADITRALAGL